MAGDELQIRSNGAGLEIVDQALDTWLVQVEPGTAGLQAATSPAGMVGRATMRGLVDAMPTRSETSVIEAFCNHLQAEGWAVEREVDFVDVKATRDGVTLLAEAKGITASPGLDVDTLYGQLLRRIAPTDSPTRYVVLVPEKVRPKAERVHESVRARLGIEIVGIDETRTVRWQSDRP